MRCCLGGNAGARLNDRLPHVAVAVVVGAGSKPARYIL